MCHEPAACDHNLAIGVHIKITRLNPHLLLQFLLAEI